MNTLDEDLMADYSKHLFKTPEDEPQADEASQEELEKIQDADMDEDEEDEG